MNLPNQLTVSRIGLTFLMTVFLTVSSIPFAKTLALLVFIAASITDYWDGRLARRMNNLTAFGKLMDPLADKVLVCAAFVSFVAMQQIVPAWVVITIMTREFLVTGLRLLAASGGKVMQAGWLGKHKTVWQIVVIIVILAGLAIRDDLLPRLPPGQFVDAVMDAYGRYFHNMTYTLSLMTAMLTVVSGVVYLWQNRSLVINEV